MSNLFGIYVGNSTASIAIYKEEGKVDVLANEAGDRVTPAVVSLSSDEKVVGPTSISFSKASCTVTNNKRLLYPEIEQDDLERYISQSAVPVNTEKGLLYTILETDKKYFVCTPTDVAVLIFQKLYNIGVGACGQKNLSCVLCAPRKWNDEGRKILRDAAVKAGWNVLQVVNESPAALLAYRIGFEKPPRDLSVLVYRLGGVSCEATVVKVERGMYSILSSIFQPTGGEAMVKALTVHLVEEFSRKYYVDPTESRRSLWKFKAAAKSILHTLSTVPMCSQFIESACEGIDFNVSVSVARFNSLLAPLLPGFVAPIHKALENAQLSPSNISKVILCGGCLKVPKIRSYVSSFFECESFCSIQPDEVFAFGAAEQAGLVHNLGQNLDSTTEIPFISSPIFMKFGPEEVVLENTIIPAFQQISIEPMDGPLNISALQGTNEGKINMDSIDTSSGIDMNVKVTLQGGIQLEAINKANNESINGFIDFQVD